MERRSDVEPGQKLLAARVRQEREAKGLTLDHVAQATGRTKAFWSDFERGRRACSLSTLTALATALDTTVVDLLAGIPQYGPANRR